MKQAVLRLMQGSGAFTAFRLANRHKALILTYHRFSEDGRDGSTSVQALSEQLEFLTSHYQLVKFSTLADCLARRRSLPPGVAAITIDDGYADAYEVALPILRRYGVPATVFVVTDFLDGRGWLWTDQIRYLILHTKSLRFEGEINHHPVNVQFNSHAARMEAATRFNALLKTVSEERKHKLITTISELLAVELPKQTPPEFAAMTWQQAREMEANGVEIGSHTVTHPILTQVSDAQLNTELGESKSKLEAELGHASDLFCYPNGDTDGRVRRAARRAGYRAAVTTEEGLNGQTCDLLALRRVHGEADFARFIQRTSGFEQMKNRFYALAKAATAVGRHSAATSKM
jgi:peptidoglycan/xylan/chitin deacetylase (PgdA/CDA1 family)